jgi:DNA repair protein RAD50
VEQSGQVDAEIVQQEQNLANVRSRLAEIEKEIHTGEATQANLRENVRVRKLAADIAKIESEIRELDVGGAAQAFTEFEEKYAKLIKKASELQNKVFIKSILERSLLTVFVVHVSWRGSYHS